MMTLASADSIIDDGMTLLEPWMPSIDRTSPSRPENARDALVNAVISAWQAESSSAMSTRSVAGRAGLRISSIHYHFSTMGHLLESAHEVALQDAERWCAARLDALDHDIGGASAIGSLLAALVDDWCEARRSLAFAWRECHIAALRDPAYQSRCARWQALWQDFWTEICGRIGIEDMTTPTAWLFESMSVFHLHRWRRPVDMAALMELCLAWADWIDGRPSRDAFMYELARRSTADLMPLSRPDDAVEGAIALAAADIIAEKGVAGLTHRAVAAASGLTLGVVSYRWRTSGHLIHAAFEAMYRRFLSRGDDIPSVVRRISHAEAYRQLDARRVPSADVIAIEELLIAAARDPALNALGAKLRYARGRSGFPILQALVGEGRPVTPIDGAIFSSLLHGRLRAYDCVGRSPPVGAAKRQLEQVLSRLGGVSPKGDRVTP